MPSLVPSTSMKGRTRPPPIKTEGLPLHVKFNFSDKSSYIMTYDIIPYVFDKYGRPICENEAHTVTWVDEGVDKYGVHIGSRLGKSVLDQLTNCEIDILTNRVKLSKKNYTR